MPSFSHLDLSKGMQKPMGVLTVYLLEKVEGNCAYRYLSSWWVLTVYLLNKCTREKVGIGVWVKI